MIYSTDLGIKLFDSVFFVFEAILLPYQKANTNAFTIKVQQIIVYYL